MSREAIRPHYDAVVGLFPPKEIPELAYGIVKLTYALGETPQLMEAEPLQRDIWDEGLENRLAPGSDYWLFKPGTDVIVEGDAVARRPTRSMRVQLRVGAVRRSIAVFGRRMARWDAAGRVGFSEPEPFERMPMEWGRAYGGCDPRVPVAAPHDLASAMALECDHPGLYPRNPLGRGYAVLDQRAPEVELPNLEDAADLLTPERFVVGDPQQWYRQPLPACWSWASPVMFHRYIHWGLDAWFTPPQDARMPEVARGLLPPNYRGIFGPQPGAAPGAEFTQEAAPGLVFDGLRPGTEIELSGMHTDGAIRFAMPHAPPLELLSEDRRRRIEPRLTTVVLRPNEKRMTLTYVALEREMPRTFVPGIHGRIPLALAVAGDTPVAYQAPPTIRARLAAAQGAQS